MHHQPILLNQSDVRGILQMNQTALIESAGLPTEIAVGTFLWGCETFALAGDEDQYHIQYLADNPQQYGRRDLGYLSPAHMPKYASRIRLLVTDIVIKPLHSLTDKEMQSTGIFNLINKDSADNSALKNLYYFYQSKPYIGSNNLGLAKTAYASIAAAFKAKWLSIYSSRYRAGKWNSNPLVRIYYFKLLPKNSF